MTRCQWRTHPSDSKKFIELSLASWLSRVMGTAAQLHCLEACASAKAKAALRDAAPNATFHSGHESLKLWIPQQMISAVAAHKSPVRL